MKNMRIIKKLKKKKAFTLVELVGVLVIIGILNIILIPVVSNSLKNSKQRLYEKQIDTIIMAAKAFASDYAYVLPEENNQTVSINLGQLKDTGYIDKEVKNPINNNNFSECMLINITNNAGNYDYDVEDENIPESCDRSSSVAISLPSKRFIKNNQSSSYIITVSNGTGLFVNYDIDKSKITLNTDTDAQYGIIGENGIYKITIYSGIEQGEVAFVLNDGAITDESGNSVVSGESPSITIVVDTSAPTIVFGTNGNNTYQKSQSSTITVNDNNSGDTSSYKYIYSTSNSAIPNVSFTSGDSYSQSSGDGDYYLIATACDQAGNCTTEKSNVFKLDNTAPTIAFGTNGNSTYAKSQSSTITVNKNDSYSDLNTDSYKYIYSNNNSATPNASFTSGNSYSQSSGDGDYYLRAYACDVAGNCVTETSNAFKLDNTAPTAPTLNNPKENTWTNSNFSITCSTAESGSGVAYWQYTYTSGSGYITYANSNSTSLTTTEFTTERNQDVYIRVCDNVGNCSNESSSRIKIDKTDPTCSERCYYQDNNGRDGKSRLYWTCNDNTNGSGIVAISMNWKFTNAPSSCGTVGSLNETRYTGGRIEFQFGCLGYEMPIFNQKVTDAAGNVADLANCTRPKNL